jgi:hypothetical protein
MRATSMRLCALLQYALTIRTCLFSPQTHAQAHAKIRHRGDFLCLLFLRRAAAFNQGLKSKNR